MSSAMEVNKVLYTFLKGSVGVVANADRWASDKPFILVFNSENHNGWGITKTITQDEAEKMTKDKGEAFYFEALELLGVA